MKPRKLFLLLAILVCGGASEALFEVRDEIDLGPSGCRVITGHFRGPSFSFEAQEARELPAGASLSVENAFGGVRVHAGEAGRARVTLRKVVFLPTEGDARSFAEGVRLEVTMDGATLRVRTNRGEVDRHVGLETHIDVEVPPGSGVRIRNEHGEVTASDVGAADLDTSYGDATLERAAGDASITTRHGRQTASDVKGALKLQSRYGDVTASNVGGRVELDSEHGDVEIRDAGGVRVDARYGALTAERLRGPLEVKGEHIPVHAEEIEGAATIATNYADVRVRKVGGEARLKTEHGDVDASGIAGDALVETSYAQVTLEDVGGVANVKTVHGGVSAKELRRGGRIDASGDAVDVDGFGGGLDVEAQRASVHVVPSGRLAQPLTVRTTNGDIRLEIADGSAFTLAAQSRGGELGVTLPGFTVTDSERGRVAGTVGGGGSLVTLAADHGDVQVSRRETVAQK